MKKRAVGYVRVSSAEQVKGTSPDTQEEAIKKYAEASNWKLIHIYSDLGISGAGMEKRVGLQQLLKDSAQGKFEIMICLDIDRFGRDTVDIGLNRRLLHENNVEDKFITGPEDSEFVKDIKASVAAEERRKMIERLIRGRLKQLEKGIPIGPKPFNRHYDYGTHEWSFIDPEKNRIIEWAAKQYLDGATMVSVVIGVNEKGLKLSQSGLNRILRDKCGDRWTYHLEGRTFEFSMPAILYKDTIAAMHKRMSFNRTYNRKDVKKYVLQGFIYCAHCHRALTGQSVGRGYIYYTHRVVIGCKRDPKYVQCPMKMMDDAVFRIIYSYVIDLDSFEKAIAKNAPDDTFINSLKDSIKYEKRAIKKAEADFSRFHKLVIEGTLKNKQQIQKTEAKLTTQLENHKSELDRYDQRLGQLPRRDKYEKDAKRIRQQLLTKFASLEHLLEMPYEQKRKVLHSVFDGKDSEGHPYGVYIDEKGIKHGKAGHFWKFTIKTHFMTESEFVQKDGMFFGHWLRRESVKNQARRKTQKKDLGKAPGTRKRIYKT